MEGCLKHNIQANPWTVDDPDLMKRLAKAGVHAVITNQPALALETLK